MDAQTHVPADAVTSPRPSGHPFADDDPSTLARRIEHVVAVLDRHDGALCAGCDVGICGHQVLFSLAAGHEDAPLCLGCLSEELGRTTEDLRTSLLSYVLSRECLARGWRLCAEREGSVPGDVPTCVRGGRRASVTDVAGTSPRAAESQSPVATVASGAATESTWDAGDLGCGELVLELRMQLSQLPPGAVLRVRALDPGAPEDLPSWCRLTGHALVRAAPPEYWIRRKD